MNVQYITDDTGKTTGVFIPISDWNGLKSKYAEINEESIIPESHKEIIRNRMTEYNTNPEIGLDYDEVIAELKNE
ncbi:MAG: addiction module protein [Saprospiraceae bacterium]|nr:addiction module protein [Saprospiraceae bacterium]